MIIDFKIKDKEYCSDLSKGVSLSIPLSAGKNNPKAFWAIDPSIDPVVTDSFNGDTQDGGLCNFKDVLINPHGNGTHTECVGHISREVINLPDSLKDHHCLAQIESIKPTQIGNDHVITQAQILALNIHKNVEAFIIRTLPNSIDKKSKDYSGTNPAYIHHDAIEILVEKGIKHLLLDLPSVDREEDDGKLLAHRAFWKYPSDEVRNEATITEMIYVPKEVKDGQYFLNIQVTSLVMDASPSNIVIYPLL